jgi:hypothetical protein
MSRGVVDTNHFGLAGASWNLNQPLMICSIDHYFIRNLTLLLASSLSWEPAIQINYGLYPPAESAALLVSA